MSFDWSGLADAIERRIKQRLSQIEFDEENQRRKRQIGQAAIAAPVPLAPVRFARTGIATKAPRQEVAAHVPTVAGTLRAEAPLQPTSIIALTEAVTKYVEEDEERNSRGGGGSGGGSGVARVSPTRLPASPGTTGALASRAATAAGAQPVVIKVTSTISSKASASRLIDYLGTRKLESNEREDTRDRIDIPILDQDGNVILSAADRASVLAEWEGDFREAYAVNSVMTLALSIPDHVSDEHLHQALNQAFGRNPFTYARKSETVQVCGVHDAHAKKLSASIKSRATGQGSTDAVAKAEAAIAASLQTAGLHATVRIDTVATSGQSGRYRLEAFLRDNPVSTTSTGDLSDTQGRSSTAARRIWQEWQPHIRTMEPRNAFHVVFSARAGTDPEAMTGAVRNFLGEQLASHRWITAYHPETGHVHVHAMIAARDELGKPLRLTKPELYAWRAKFAEKAREQGIAMVATRRSDLAATRPYTREQAAARERVRTDPRYLKQPAVIARVDNKRAGVIDTATLSNGSLALSQKWQATRSVLTAVNASATAIQSADRFARAAVAAERQAVAVKGFLVLRVEFEELTERSAAERAAMAVTGASRDAIAGDARIIAVLAPTQASISKIEREIARGESEETRRITQGIRRKFAAQGVKASVTITAAGSARDGKPTAWLSAQFQQVSADGNRKEDQTPTSPLDTLNALLISLKTQQERLMSLSLEQFEERVVRTNKSIDRLGSLVNSDHEKQAVAELRQEINALLVERRKELVIAQNQAPTSDTASTEAKKPPSRDHDRPKPVSIDPALVQQQAAIAAARAAKSARDQAESAKATQAQNRQETLKQIQVERSARTERDDDRGL